MCLTWEDINISVLDHIGLANCSIDTIWSTSDTLHKLEECKMELILYQLSINSREAQSNEYQCLQSVYLHNTFVRD